MEQAPAPTSAASTSSIPSPRSPPAAPAPGAGISILSPPARSHSPAITIVSPPRRSSPAIKNISAFAPPFSPAKKSTPSASAAPFSPAAPVFSPSVKSAPSASAPEFIPASAIPITNLGINIATAASSPNSATSSPTSSTARPPTARRRNQRGNNNNPTRNARAARSAGDTDEPAVHAPRKRGARKNRTRPNKDKDNNSNGNSNSSSANDSNATSDHSNNGPVLPKAEVKLIVRRLPPRLTSEDYFSGSAAERGASNAVWKSYHTGAIVGPHVSVSCGASKKNSGALKCTRHSTAYLAFATTAAAAAFFSAENGTKYTDPKNNAEYIARVEKSPFQVVPRVAYYASKKPSVVHGTIEADAHYKKFLAELEKENEMHENTEAVGPVAVKPKIKGSQPVEVSKLMEDVRARRKTRDSRKNSKKGDTNAGGTAGTRSTRRRGRRAAAAAKGTSGTTPGTGIGNGKPILLKKNKDNSSKNEAAEKPPSKSKGRASRAAKRAAAAAGGNGSNGNGNGNGNAEGDGVYVVRMAPKSADGTQSPRGTPGRSRKQKKNKNNSNNAHSNTNGNNSNTAVAPVVPVASPAFRLLKKDTLDGLP